MLVGRLAVGRQPLQEPDQRAALERPVELSKRRAAYPQPIPMARGVRIAPRLNPRRQNGIVLGGEMGQPRHRHHDRRVRRLQQRHDGLAKPIAAMGRVAVARVVAEGDLVGPAVRLKLALAKHQERSQQGQRRMPRHGRLGAHPAQPVDACAANHVQQHSFRLIVGMMRRGDPIGVDIGGALREKRIARIASAFLDAGHIGVDPSAPDSARDAPTPRRLRGEHGVIEAGVSAQAVVKGRRRDANAQRRRDLNGGMQQRQRVRPA